MGDNLLFCPLVRLAIYLSVNIFKLRSNGNYKTCLPVTLCLNDVHLERTSTFLSEKLVLINCPPLSANVPALGVRRVFGDSPV